MNTLNNIHALIDIDAELAKDTVIELSKMMRYVLYDSEQDSISLEKEVQFLQHYIQLMRLRYSDTVEINLNTPAQPPLGVKVPPLIMIVFVENAFKHGVSYDSPSFVHINLWCDDDNAICQVRNSRHKGLKVEKGGIGLENVRKRLDLIYGPEGYTLDILKEEERYTVKLIIPTLYA